MCCFVVVESTDKPPIVKEPNCTPLGPTKGKEEEIEVDAADIEFDETFLEEVRDGTARRKAFDSNYQCVVDAAFTGDEALMQNMSEKDENLQNVLVFIAIMALATFATAICCYLVFNFEARLALAIFVMVLVAYVFDLFLFRNLIALIIALCKHRRGKQRGYEYLAVESRRTALPQQDEEVEEKAIAGRRHVNDHTGFPDPSESESKHGS